MSTPRSRKKVRPASKPVPDPKLLLPKLRARLAREQTALDRWQKRLVRTFHAYEREHRLVARITRRIAKLESV